MANYKFTGLIIGLVVFSAFTINNNISWTINDNHSIKFNTKKVEGNFETFTGDIQFDKDNIDASTFNVKIDVNSISTGNFLKNRHAKAEDWFNAEKYPTITFVSDSFAKTDSGYEVTGIIELRGIQKEITMPFTFLDNVFKSKFSINRTDFKVGKTTGMSGSVGQVISIDVTVPVTK